MKYFAILLLTALVVSSTALSKKDILERTEKIIQALKNLYGGTKQINTDKLLETLEKIKRPTLDSFLFTFLRLTVQTKPRNFNFIPPEMMRKEINIKNLKKYVRHLISSHQKVTTVSDVFDQLKPNIKKILAEL